MVGTIAQNSSATAGLSKNEELYRVFESLLSQKTASAEAAVSTFIGPVEEDKPAKIKAEKHAIAHLNAVKEYIRLQLEETNEAVTQQDKIKSIIAAGSQSQTASNNNFKNIIQEEKRFNQVTQLIESWADIKGLKDLITIEKRTVLNYFSAKVSKVVNGKLSPEDLADDTYAFVEKVKTSGLNAGLNYITQKGIEMDSSKLCQKTHELLSDNWKAVLESSVVKSN